MTRQLARLGGRIGRPLVNFVRADTDDGTRRTRRQRGQALPLFVLMIFVVTGSVAVVTDVSWFWVNQQKMQRAADAGALAGAIYLPGNVSGAYAAAQAATARNGYANGVGNVVVTPQQDPSNKRRLGVTVQGPVGTYFARVFGMNQITASAKGKAEFTLPVPMGSPQNYYGVGTYIYNQITYNNTNNSGDTGFDPEANVASGTWTGPANAAAQDSIRTSTGTNNAQQVWNSFGLQGAGGLPNDPTLAVDGLEVRLNGVYISGSGTSSNCYVAVEVTWDGGANWGTAVNTAALNTTTTTVRTVGSNTSTAAFGGHSWSYGDFTNNNFRVRLSWLNGSGNGNCGTSRVANLDQLLVRVSYHTVTTTPVYTRQTGTVTAPGGGTLATQGFWGAVITRGGSRENGDEYSPQNDNASISGHTSTNPEYDSSGYDYTVIVGSNGQVRVFDPTFCETGPNGSGGNMGAGDHWIGGQPNGVTTVFSLWSENGTPYDTSDDTQVATSGNTFANEIQADYSGTMGTPGHSGLTDCSASPYHNAWWTLANNLAPGRYRVNVNTSSANNTATNAENMWSLWTNSGGNPQVYGEAKMAAYNNLVSGTQLFYLAQIDAANAGKTMEIVLFDPGDVSGNAFLKIESPDGNSYNYATFSWTADNGTSGNNVTQIQTASAGGSFFNDRVITIDVVLPSSYGSSGLTPPGETEAGWWKIEYTVGGGNDTTTWSVAIRGSPVHLVQ